MPRTTKKGENSDFAQQPGGLYSRIELAEAEGGEQRLLKRLENPFVLFCKAVYSRFPSLGEGAKFDEKQKSALDFLGWDLSPAELSATSKFALFALLIAGTATATIILVTPLNDMLSEMVGQGFVFVYVALPFVIIAFLLTNYIQNYPSSAAELEKTKALTYVPEMIGYMIMSMKLVPNLEKAVEFSAEHGSGKIAEDFKRILWDVQLGVYNTVSEALDLLAYRWGKYSEEFKQAMMRIRASVLENTEAKRYQLLDATMVSILESIRGKMEQYARDLSQPSILLFYMGVLLPLILIIVLPVGSAFSGQAMATPPVLILLYNIIIPAVTFFFARDVIMRRPPTQAIPEIPDGFPGLPKKHSLLLGGRNIDLRLLVIAILVIGISGGLLLSNQGFPPYSMVGEEGFQFLPRDRAVAEVMEYEGKPANWYDNGGPYFQQLSLKYGPEKANEMLQVEKIQFFSKPENDTTPYALSFGLLLTLVCASAVFVYYSFIYKRKAQLDIMKMESEFKDSLYILASRLGENRPVEEALKHTRSFLPDFTISQRIFGRTIENIELLGLPLQAAIFDKNYGSLKNIPSKTIQTGMKIMVDSVKLGVNVAARTLISLSLQLRNSEKVNETLRVLISDTTSMMSSMAIFIAPIVLGVTTALQKVVMLTLSTVVSSNMDKTLESIDTASGSVPFNIPDISNVGFGVSGASFDSMVTPLQFLLIVGLYVIELVIIMTYFTTKIQEDNKLLFYINIAKSLPIAVAVFLVSVIASGAVVGGFFG
ncbi:MAG: hypothetical protein WC634_03710 [archaeon]